MVQTTITVGDLIKAMAIMATLLSGVLGGVVKLVLNGTSSRTRTMAADLREHISSTKESFAQGSEKMDELGKDVTGLKVDVATLKERSRPRGQ